MIVAVLYFSELKCLRKHFEATACNIYCETNFLASINYTVSSILIFNIFVYIRKHNRTCVVLQTTQYLKSYITHSTLPVKDPEWNGPRSILHKYEPHTVLIQICQAERLPQSNIQQGKKSGTERQTKSVENDLPTHTQWCDRGMLVLCRT